MASIQITNISASGRSTTQLIVGPSITFRGKQYYRPEDLIAKKGLKLTKLLSTKAHQAAARRQGNSPRAFPPLDWIQHQLLIHAQGPLLTINEDGEFSAKDLTRAYVQQFCAANHLKEC
jgi:hypothetical protein